MQKLLIVEDDDVQRIALHESIQEFYPNWAVLSANDYESALELLFKSTEECEYFSMFLLDIQLKQDVGDMSGFVLAEQIRSDTNYYKTPILFLTSISEKTQFALATYHCYNYITKPYSTDDILYQIQQMLLTGYLEDNCIAITDTKRIIHRIPQKDIMYLELKSHQVIFSTKQDEIISRGVLLADLWNQLTKDFIQCHKKYIINLNYVNSYTKSNGYVNINGTILPVSRTFKLPLEDALRSKEIL